MSSTDVPFEDLHRVGLTPARSAVDVAYMGVAWIALVVADLALKVMGFPRLYRIVQGWATIGNAPVHERRERARQTLEAVDRARIYYLRHARCLQRAVVAVCLVRLRGVHGVLVIGVHKIPFKAHAWMEVDDEVVNDDPRLIARYKVIARC